MNSLLVVFVITSFIYSLKFLIMIETKVVSLLADGNKTIGKVVLKDGLYYAQKVSKDYVVLHETSEGWRALGEDQKPNKKTVIILAEVQDMVAKVNRTIAVTADFLAWSIKTNFAFRIVKGRSVLELETFTKTEMSNLIKDEA